jgi:hypothetical protein
LYGVAPVLNQVTSLSCPDGYVGKFGKVEFEIPVSS